MLSREIMGLLALGIVWINTLLIIGAAFKDIGSLFDRIRSLVPWKPGKSGPALIFGCVAEGQGPGESIAAHGIEQTGRSAERAKKKTIIFSDRSFASTVHGGTVVPADSSEHAIHIEALNQDAHVWVPSAELHRQGACPPPEQFDRVYEEARKAKGHLRTIEARITKGQSVWIAGQLEYISNNSNKLYLRPLAAHGLLISTLDPRREIRRRIALSLASIALMLAAAAGVTLLALTRPYFGPVSTAGGALGLAYFLLVQPAGTALKNFIRLPDIAFVRGAWHRGK